MENADLMHGVVVRLSTSTVYRSPRQHTHENIETVVLYLINSIFYWSFTHFCSTVPQRHSATAHMDSKRIATGGKKNMGAQRKEQRANSDCDISAIHHTGMFRAVHSEVRAGAMYSTEACAYQHARSMIVHVVSIGARR
jgi:hypothetical protein